MATKKKAEEAEKPAKKQATPTASPAEPTSGVCTECGKPVAEGQTFVCSDHIRRG